MNEMTDGGRCSPEESKERRTASICITPKVFSRIFLFMVWVMIMSGTLANFAIYHVVADSTGNFADVLRRFDLGHEPSIPNYYSAVAILIAAGLLGVIGYLDDLKGVKGAKNWYLLAVVCFALSIDEAVQFHEMIDSLIGLFVQSSGVLFLPWVVVGAAFAFLVAIRFIPFIASRSKRTLKIFMVAGFVFLVGALGMEMVASLIFAQAGSEELGVATLSHTISQCCEEFLEMIGIVIFLYGLTDYLATNYSSIEIHLRRNDRTTLGESTL